MARIGSGIVVLIPCRYWVDFTKLEWKMFSKSKFISIQNASVPERIRNSIHLQKCELYKVTYARLKQNAKWLEENLYLYNYINFDVFIARNLKEKNKTNHDQLVRLKLRLRYSCYKDLKWTRIMILNADRPSEPVSVKIR